MLPYVQTNVTSILFMKYFQYYFDVCGGLIFSFNLKCPRVILGCLGHLFIAPYIIYPFFSSACLASSLD